MKRLILLILLLTTPVFAAPSNTMSITPAASDGTTITAADENSRNNEVSSKFNAHDHTDISQTANTLDVGQGGAGNKDIRANNADANKPFLRYDDTNDRWVASRNGVEITSLVVVTGTDARSFILPESPANNDILRYNSTVWTSISQGTAGQVLTLTGADLAWRGMATQGDMDYRDAVSRVALPIGSSTEVLTVASGIPAWETPGSTVTIGNFTRDMTAASGGVSYTGVGFTPKFVIFLGAVAGDVSGSWGWGDTSNQGAMFRNDGTADETISTTTAINIQTGVGASQTAVVSSLDSDGFSLTWVKGGGPTGTGTVTYMAFK